MLLSMDPPDHTRLRATINRALTPRRVAALEDPVRALARELLERMTPRGRGDIIADFAAILPMAVISRMLRVPAGDQGRLRSLSDAMLHRDDSVRGVPESGKRAAGEIYAYFEGLLAERDARRRRGSVEPAARRRAARRDLPRGDSRLLLPADRRRQRDDDEADRQHGLRARSSSRASASDSCVSRHSSPNARRRDASLRVVDPHDGAHADAGHRAAWPSNDGRQEGRDHSGLGQPRRAALAKPRTLRRRPRYGRAPRASASGFITASARRLRGSKAASHLPRSSRTCPTSPSSATASSARTRAT